VACTIANPRHDNVSGLALDRTRLAFVRFPVATGRLNELAAGDAHETVV
jgi:hypothetical protein